MTGRTGGVSFSHTWLRDSCMARASKPSTGVKPAFSLRPRITYPPLPFENADSVSAIVVLMWRRHSFTSHCWVSLPITRMRRMSRVIRAV